VGVGCSGHPARNYRWTFEAVAWVMYSDSNQGVEVAKGCLGWATVFINVLKCG